MFALIVVSEDDLFNKNTIIGILLGLGLLTLILLIVVCVLIGICLAIDRKKQREERYRYFRKHSALYGQVGELSQGGSIITPSTVGAMSCTSSTMGILPPGVPSRNNLNPIRKQVSYDSNVITSIYGNKKHSTVVEKHSQSSLSSSSVGKNNTLEDYTRTLPLNKYNVTFIDVINTDYSPTTGSLNVNNMNNNEFNESVNGYQTTIPSPIHKPIVANGNPLIPKAHAPDVDCNSVATEYTDFDESFDNETVVSDCYYNVPKVRF